MDLSKIYSLRQKYTIIAITGRTGSGCTEFAKRLSLGFEENTEIFPHPSEFEYSHNSYRKYRIVYNYASVNFKPFKIINYKDILVAYILKYELQEFISFLQSDSLKIEFEMSKLETVPDFNGISNELIKDSYAFGELHKQASFIINDSKKNDDLLKSLYDFFISPEFNRMSILINNLLMSNSLIERNKTLQVISNNLRRYGHPYLGEKAELKNIFTIAELINDLIKSIKNSNEDSNTEIVIDSLRNPFEIMFFKQRYGAFYTIAVNRSDEKRNYALQKRTGKDMQKDMNILLAEEHCGGSSAEFYKQNVSYCIQNADIHISFITKKEADRANMVRIKFKENTSPYYSWGMQLLKYIALIDHPGIDTPTPEERCMQLAYTAKYNSGCISRQVGAAITDENYSIKAIGWNNTPEGHVPCSLRNAEDLINENEDIYAFTPFERENKDFRKALIENFKCQIQDNRQDLRGQNVSFCFKSLINSYSDGKNQVHTRSLHAEESAFLQISKYGGSGILNGMLFTTASPCELCSKKAYQLGIKVIYYIDPYPGISKSHILHAGKKSRNPKIRLFDGAIGNAYHWLYEPFMSYKDELALLLNLDIKDLTKKYKEEIDSLKSENKRLKKELVELKICLPETR